MKTRCILQCGLIFIGTFVSTAIACHDVELGFINGLSAVPVGSPASYSLSEAASCDKGCTSFTYTWKVTVNSTVVSSSSGSSISYSQIWSGIGTKTLSVTASCGGDAHATASKEIRVVGVKSVSAGGVESTANPSPLGSIPKVYVAKGSQGQTIPVTAEPNPSGAWPTNRPTWTNATPTATSGQATFPIHDVSQTSDGTFVRATCGSSAKAIKIVVVEVDLDMAGVDESDEESVGGFIGVNNDDDNANGIPDKDETGTVTGEDDLVAISLSVSPSLSTGEMKLEAVSGSSKIKVWENATKGTEVTLPKTWDLSSESMPATLYVEGIGASSELKDIELMLSYVKGATTVYDKVKMTVIEVDLDMEGVDDAKEETVGGFIALNDDDDDFDGVMDIDDGYNKDGIPGNDDDVNMSENDLVKITLNKVLPESLTGSLTLSAGNGIKIWQSAIKGGAALTLPVQFNTPADLPKELWIEGVMASTEIRDSFVRLEYEIGDRTFMDNIKITVIDVDITTPAGSLDWGRNPQSSWQNTAPYHFDFQGIIAGEPGAYALQIRGEIAPSTLTYKWTLDASCGTLSDDSIDDPDHIPPASEGQGTLKLEAYYNGNPTGIYEERVIKIYPDHLARDCANFGTGGYCVEVAGVPWKVSTFNVHPQPTMNNWNCHGSTRHAYDGSYDSNNTGQPWLSWSVKTFVVVNHDPQGNGNCPSLGTVERGDIVCYFSPNGQQYNPPLISDRSSWVLQHSQTCLGGGASTYGANNEPKSYPGAPGQGQSWKWYESPAGDWANHIWQPNYQGYYVPFIVVVFDKP